MKKSSLSHTKILFAARPPTFQPPRQSSYLITLRFDDLILCTFNSFIIHGSSPPLPRMTTTTASTATFVLPGEGVPQDSLPVPSNPSIPLKLGPGLQHTPPSTITTVLAGSLCIDAKKKAIWVENNTGRVLTHPIPLPLRKIHPCASQVHLSRKRVLICSVYSPDARCCSRHRSSLLNRLLPLCHHASHSACSAPSTSI